VLPDPALWKRLSPLVDELLDLEGDARAGRLRELHRQDAALAAELEKLLAAAGQAQGALFLAGVADEATLAAAPTLQGQRLGAYTLVGPLGQGGTGAVWRARRDDGRFEGEVAIKLLHLSLLGQSGAGRFRREGAILARLTHPNIARLLDAGISDGGQPYLVLELVEGERIDRHCDAHKLGVDRRLDLFAQVVAAVAHAHSHLAIHRDIKPTNILVDRDGRAKLLDFGIAKLIEDEAQTSTQITREGARAMTPEYAAPEQLRGDPITTATDVYALGVLLYQLLTGRHPTAPATGGAAQAMRATLDTEPELMSNAWRSADGATLDEVAAQRATEPAPLRRQLRGDLEQIVARTLRKLPQERYASVEALAEDLRRYRAHEPVSARPDSFGYRCARFVRRHRGGVAAAVLTSLAIVAGVVGTVTQARRAEQQARQAQHERDNALRDLQFANASRDVLTFLLSQGRAKSMTSIELLAGAEQLTDQQFESDPLTRGRLQMLLGIEYGNLLEFEKSKAVLQRAHASALTSGSADLIANVECLLASTLGDQNQPDEARALFDAAIARIRLGPGETSGVLAACLQMRADLNAQRGQPQEMLADAQAALAQLGTPRADQRVLANSLQILAAEAYSRLGRPAEAVAAYEHSIADLESMGRQRTTRTAIRYNNFSRILYVGGQPRRAAEMAGRGLEIVRAGTEANTLNAILEANQSRAFVDLGRHDEAQALTEHAFALALERKDVRWAGTIALYGAPAWCAGGALERCAEMIERAREHLGRTLPPGHSNYGAIEIAAAQLALARGRPDAARDGLRRADAIFAAAPEKSPLRVRALALLARTELQLGDAAAAARAADAALAEARAAAAGFVHSAWLGEALAALGRVQQARGDAAAAATLKEAAAHLAATLGETAPATRELSGAGRGP
jgi:serine/threonine protein kinase